MAHLPLKHLHRTDDIIFFKESQGMVVVFVTLCLIYMRDIAPDTYLSRPRVL